MTDLEKLKQLEKDLGFEIENIEINKTKNNVLPYSIKRINVNNYQGLNNVEIKDIPIDTKWIFLTGENGYGKTSLLQAIVIGLIGNQDGKIILNNEAEISLELKNGYDSYVNYVKQKEDFTVKFQNFAAYGPSRLIKSPRPYNDSQTNSLFNAYGELLDIEERLIAWENDKEQHKYWESTKSILIELLKPQIQDIIIERIGTEFNVKYIEFDNSKIKKFSELASGYRSIISMVGDIIIRLSKNQSNITDFKNLEGIVIIDEIDLHLHPKWQKTIVEKLTELFPKILFIASTHSPIPLLGAPENTLIINVQRQKEKGITAEKLEIDFSRLLPNSILTSPIFDFEDIIPKSKSKKYFLQTEDNFNEIRENDLLKKEISEFLTPQKTDELLNLFNIIDNEENK